MQLQPCWAMRIAPPHEVFCLRLRWSGIVRCWGDWSSTRISFPWAAARCWLTANALRSSEVGKLDLRAKMNGKGDSAKLWSAILFRWSYLGLGGCGWSESTGAIGVPVTSNPLSQASPQMEGGGQAVLYRTLYFSLTQKFNRTRSVLSLFILLPPGRRPACFPGHFPH